MKKDLLPSLSPDAKRVALRYLRTSKLIAEHTYCFYRRSERELWSEELGRYIYRGPEIEFSHSNCEFNQPADDCCKHGVYVGGCGIDYMCDLCESGYSDYEIALNRAHDYDRRQREEFKSKTLKMMNRNVRDMPEWAVRQMVDAWTVLTA